MGGLLGVLQTEAVIEKECPENDWDCLMSEVQQNNNVKMNTKSPVAMINGLNSLGYMSVEFENNFYVQITETFEFRVFEDEIIGDTSKEELEEIALYWSEKVMDKSICIHETQKEILKEIYLQSGKIEKDIFSLTDEEVAYYSQPMKTKCRTINPEGKITYEDEGFSTLYEKTKEKTSEINKPLKESAPKPTSLSETGAKGILRSFFDWVLEIFR